MNAFTNCKPGELKDFSLISDAKVALFRLIADTVDSCKLSLAELVEICFKCLEQDLKSLFREKGLNTLTD